MFSRSTGLLTKGQMSRRLFRCLALAGLCLPTIVSVLAADNLRLRDGISFMHDLDKGFPIIADKMEDVKLDSGRPALIFFGAAGDLNTNRQARRVVDLYKKYKATGTKFIVIDVDHAGSSEARALIKSYYQGYIPGVVVLDKQGKSTWNHFGETDLASMVTQLDKVLEDKTEKAAN